MDNFLINQKNLYSINQSEIGTNTEVQSSENSVFEENEVKVIAHRGDSDDAPENTLPAFELAAENGYDTIECDVSWTKDDVPVILHDNTINRTARNFFGFRYLFPRVCSNMNYEKISKIDFGSWFDEKYEGTKIPTFNEMLDCAKENELGIYVEIKDNAEFDEDKAKYLIKAVKEKNMEENVTWISFDEKYLEKIKNLSPNSRIGYLSRSKINDETLDTLDNLKTDDNEVFLDIKHTKVTQEGAQMLQEAGYDFESWTLDETDELKELFELGCKGITTNKLSKDEVESIFYQ